MSENVNIPTEEVSALENVQSLLRVLEKPIDQSNLDTLICPLVHAVRRKIGIHLIGFFSKGGLNFFVKKIEERFPELKISDQVRANIESLIEQTHQSVQNKLEEIPKIEQQIKELEAQKEKLKTEEKNLIHPSCWKSPKRLLNEDMKTDEEEANFVRLLLESDSALVYLGGAIEYIPKAEQLNFAEECFSRLEKKQSLLDEVKIDQAGRMSDDWSSFETIDYLIKNDFGARLLDFSNISNVLSNSEGWCLGNILLSLVDKGLGGKAVEKLNLEELVNKVAEDDFVSNSFVEFFVEAGLVRNLLIVSIFKRMVDSRWDSNVTNYINQISKIETAAKEAGLLDKFEEVLVEAGIERGRKIMGIGDKFKKIKN